MRIAYEKVPCSHANETVARALSRADNYPAAGAFAPPVFITVKAYPVARAFLGEGAPLQETLISRPVE